MSRIIANNIRHNDATADSISLTSTARVGIGTDAPSVVVEAQAAQAELQLKSTSGTNSAGLRFVPGGETNALYIYADGSRNINFDNHATSLISVRSGGGITFNGDTSTDNALDDYEEGTWDPVYNFSTSGDATTVGFGRYIKVGSIVHIQAYLYINNSNTLNGNVLIAGLPFASSSSPSQRTSAFVIGQCRRFPEDHVYLRLLLEANSSAIKMYNNDTSSNGNNRLTNANFTAAAEQNILAFSGAYTV